MGVESKDHRNSNYFCPKTKRDEAIVAIIEFLEKRGERIKLKPSFWSGSRIERLVDR
jgi:hypothetical protein